MHLQVRPGDGDVPAFGRSRFARRSETRVRHRLGRSRRSSKPAEIFGRWRLLSPCDCDTRPRGRVGCHRFPGDQRRRTCSAREGRLGHRLRAPWSPAELRRTRFPGGAGHRSCRPRARVATERGFRAVGRRVPTEIQARALKVRFLSRVVQVACQLEVVGDFCFGRGARCDVGAPKCRTLGLGEEQCGTASWFALPTPAEVGARVASPSTLCRRP
jgi:hypothetical protein